MTFGSYTMRTLSGTRRFSTRRTILAEARTFAFPLRNFGNQLGASRTQESTYRADLMLGDCSRAADIADFLD